MTDVDNVMYVGTPVNEVVFYFDDGGVVKSIELSAFGITLVPQEERKVDVNVNVDVDGVIGPDVGRAPGQGQVVLD